MLTLGIRYLMGCVVATDAADRRRVEWPPHPGRVFMALAAAHFQTENDPTERAALEWMETQPPPQIHAASQIERSLVTYYVPVNDKAGPSKALLQSAPGLTRTRQPRTYARAWLENDTVYLVWSEAQPTAHFDALANLCSKVTRIGHSSSLVQVWASQQSPKTVANWIPDENRATQHFRVPAPGTLRYLERQFNLEEINEFFELRETAGDASDRKRQKVAKTRLKERFQDQTPVRLRPEISFAQGYASRHDHPEPMTPGTVFDPRLIVYGLRCIDGPYRYLDLAATLQLTGRFREALIQHLGAGAPEVLTGHQGTGRSERPHVAYLPLPFVGHEHAHGGILGIALAVPRDLDAADRTRLLRAVAAIRREGLKLGALGRWNLESADVAPSRIALRNRVWTASAAGAGQWATVTPYVYDRHAKSRNKAACQAELAESIRQSWHRVRESPDVTVEVIITPVSAHLGAPASHQFPRLTRKDGSECRHTHAILIFNRAVVGPVLLGAGRYRGYGLCRPLEVEE